MRVVLGNPGVPLQRARASGQTDSSFTAPAPTGTKPSGAGVVDFGGSPPAWVKLVPFGAGSDNNTFTVRLIGWSLAAGTAGTDLWVPHVLFESACTLSTAVGVSGGLVTDSERFADTVAAPTTNLGADDVDCHRYSPQNNTPGSALVDACGCTLFRVDAATGGSATNGNALIGPG